MQRLDHPHSAIHPIASEGVALVRGRWERQKCRPVEGRFSKVPRIGLRSPDLHARVGTGWKAGIRTGFLREICDCAIDARTEVRNLDLCAKTQIALGEIPLRLLSPVSTLDYTVLRASWNAKSNGIEGDMAIVRERTDVGL